MMVMNASLIGLKRFKKNLIDWHCFFLEILRLFVFLSIILGMRLLSVWVFSSKLWKVIMMTLNHIRCSSLHMSVPNGKDGIDRQVKSKSMPKSISSTGPSKS